MSYMQTRTTLWSKQAAIATQLQTRDALTLIQGHHFDTLTLCSGTNSGLQMSAPFLMLSLNLDDAAYCFCRHALGVDWPESDLNFTTDTVRKYCETPFPRRRGGLWW